MTDNQKWVCIYKSNNKFEAEAVKGHLEAEGISCVMLNKQDSSYLNFGYVELHVPESISEKAKQLIEDSETQAK